MESRRYRFGPHPHAGWLLGLRGSQVAGTIGAGVFAIALLRVGGTVSLLLVIGELGAAFCVIGLRFAGHTALEWVPVVARFAYARAAGRARWRSQTARMGHVTQLPHGAQLDPREVLPPISLRAELSDLELLEVRLPRFGGVAMGVVHDKRAHSFTATVRCEARAFYLLGDAEREMMLASYGALLTTFASDDSPVRRIAWYERTLPPGSDELVEYLHEHHRPDLADDDRGLHATWQLLSAQGRGSEDHEVLVSLQIDSQRATAARSIFHLGGGTDGALSLLADQVSKLVDELTRIGVQSAQPVGARNPAVPSARGLAAIIRNGVDPFGRHERDRGTNGGIGTDSFGPRARETEWNHIVADGRKERALREGAFVRERSQQSTWRRMTPDGAYGGTSTTHALEFRPRASPPAAIGEVRNCAPRLRTAATGLDRAVALHRGPSAPKARPRRCPQGRQPKRRAAAGVTAVAERRCDVIRALNGAASGAHANDGRHCWQP